MEILGKLFGSDVRVKVIRLFLLSPESIFDAGTIATRVQEDPAKVRREVSNLNKIKFLKRRSRKIRGRSGYGYMLNKNFPYLDPLHNFLVGGRPLQPSDLVKKVSRLGPIKLLVTAGVFIKDPDSRVDMLVVADNIKKARLDRTIKDLEADVGKELRYAYFSTPDFLYRLDMYDKLIRDILDYPHEKLVNKLAII